MSGQSSIRQRKKGVVKLVEDVDVFPKVPETCVETTSYGGTASLLALILIGWLVLLELGYYLDTGYKFKFSPDTDLDEKLTMNVDLTVAMPCSIVGADVVDSTSQNVMKFGELEEEYVHFELSSSQRAYFNAKARLNSYLRESYHSLQDLLWKNDFINLYTEMPTLSNSEKFDLGPANGCRLHGTLVLNKVAGNFHLTAGKTLPLPRGHAHIAAFMSDRDYNFSHRIYKFSFGESMPSVILPLEGDEKIAHTNHMSYQYFIQVVPTLVRTHFRTYKTYQYSVRELAREIDHDKGSHGISGIFFKYDMSGLKVEVKEEDYPLWQFLVRLCAVIGGVYATVGLVYNLLSSLGCTVRDNFGSGRSSDTSPRDFNFKQQHHQQGYSVFNNPPPPPHQHPSSNNPNPMLSSPLLRGGAGMDVNPKSEYESPLVQFVGHQQPQGPLCDIAAVTTTTTTPLLDKDKLPDLLSSHASHSSS